MRHRLKKSQAQQEPVSTKSGNEKDSSHSRNPSAPNDSPRTSLSYASEAISSLKNTMGISRNQAPTPNPSTTTTTTAPAATAPEPARPSSRAATPSNKKPGPPPMTSASTNSTNNNGLSRTLSTIRTVTSSDDRPSPTHNPHNPTRPSIDDEHSSLSSLGSPSLPRHSNSAFSSSVNSTVSTVSTTSSSSQPHSPMYSSRSTNSASPNGRAIPKQSATASTLTTVPSASNLEVSSTGLQHSSSYSKLRSAAAQFESSSATAAIMSDEQNGEAWDSTVGKAGLGKTGRVINRLVAENDALKRDIKIERLKADEARQAARLLEDKMERTVSDYESRLLEASVTKTLLARKERQVESLQDAVELEKKRTADAQDRERTWREELGTLRKDAKVQVEEATTHAALMEGRYNAISSHWRSQGDMVNKTASALRKDIAELVEQRRGDDDKISTLRELCDQQDNNIKVLYEQKEAIAKQFEAYKKEQEQLLADIKTNATRRETEQEATLAEARQVLNKLKWALNIKSTIEWAE